MAAQQQQQQQQQQKHQRYDHGSPSAHSNSAFFDSSGPPSSHMPHGIWSIVGNAVSALNTALSLIARFGISPPQQHDHDHDHDHTHTPVPPLSPVTKPYKHYTHYFDQPPTNVKVQTPNPLPPVRVTKTEQSVLLNPNQTIRLLHPTPVPISHPLFSKPNASAHPRALKWSQVVASKTKPQPTTVVKSEPVTATKHNTKQSLAATAKPFVPAPVPAPAVPVVPATLINSTVGGRFAALIEDADSSYSVVASPNQSDSEQPTNSADSDTKIDKPKPKPKPMAKPAHTHESKYDKPKPKPKPQPTPTAKPAVAHVISPQTTATVTVEKTDVKTDSKTKSRNPFDALSYDTDEDGYSYLGPLARVDDDCVPPSSLPSKPLATGSKQDIKSDVTRAVLTIVQPAGASTSTSTSTSTPTSPTRLNPKLQAAFFPKSWAVVGCMEKPERLDPFNDDDQCFVHEDRLMSLDNKWLTIATGEPKTHRAPSKSCSPRFNITRFAHILHAVSHFVMYPNKPATYPAMIRANVNLATRFNAKAISATDPQSYAIYFPIRAFAVLVAAYDGIIPSCTYHDKLITEIVDFHSDHPIRAHAAAVEYFNTVLSGNPCNDLLFLDGLCREPIPYP